MDRIIILNESQLIELKTEIVEAVLEGIKSLHGTLGTTQAQPEWVEGEEAMRILGYRSKTKMQELRNSGLIVFSKFGRKLKYSRQSLIDLIEKNKKVREYGR